MAKRTEQQIAIDDALTKFLNADQRIHDFLRGCTADLYRQFQGNGKVFFYLKGSAALRRYLERGGVPGAELDKISQRSDWDTQLVIDPRLPRAEWFEVFQACLKTIRESLAKYEDELLTVLAEIYQQRTGTGSSSRDQRNTLGRKVRALVARNFGDEFLKTSDEKGFTGEGGTNWDLPWDKIRAAAKDGKILDLEIQAHNQAVLTFALIHPGQALGNLNSIVTGRELRELTEKTQAEAENAWRAVAEASDDYDTVRLRTIRKSEPIMKLLAGKLTDETRKIQFEDILIASLPDSLKAELARRLSRGPEPRTGTRQTERPLSELWSDVLDKRATTEAGIGPNEWISDADVAFSRKLGKILARDPEAARWLREQCLSIWADKPAMVAALAALYDEEVTALLAESEPVQAAEQRVDELFEVYHEEPDPEDLAEAGRQETERLAPFALVAVKKGSLRAGSILENMSIRDFYLFRLMIRCQLNNREPHRLIPDVPPRMEMDVDAEDEPERGPQFDAFKQQFRFRAELLDVSVPRDDSLETAEQWSHVLGHIHEDDEGIPLPDGSYFLDEYILLFREVLDRKSSSAHKHEKRLQRACLVAEVYADHLVTQNKLNGRVTELADNYPAFKKIVGRQTQDAPVPAANLLVFMRICEQLVESYELERNERLRDDSMLILESYQKEIDGFLQNPLTKDSFFALMQRYARISKLIYNRAFALAGARSESVFSPESLSVRFAPATTAWIKTQFGDDPGRIGCAAVEDFAIKAQPDLHESVKQKLPLNVLTIVACTTDNLDDQRMRQLAIGLQVHLDTLGKNIAVHRYGNTLYALHAQKAEDLPPDLEGTLPLSSAALSVFMKIKFVADPHTENWAVPTHPRDLRAIVKQYRSTLPLYTEYYASSRKKEILRDLEKALTTY